MFSQVDTIAAEVTDDVLCTMFFSTAMPVPCEHGHAEPMMSAQVEFTGTITGEFVTVLPRRLARALGAAFLGEDEEEIGPSGEEQTICELVNILCGAILSRLCPNAHVSIAAPHLVVPDSSIATAGRAQFHQCYETPEGPLSITLQIAGAAV